MLKLNLIFLFLCSRVMQTFAGGMITNNFQSAAYSRMLSRNASTQLDAVFYNPAGLVSLDYGWHISLGNTGFAGEDRITSDYPYLNGTQYTGNVSGYLFPNLHAAYRSDRWIFSAGIGRMAGEGPIDFSRGIPSYELGISALKGWSDLGITNYQADISFSSRMAYWGFQAGATFQLNDVFSVFGGARLVTGNNVYAGYVENVQIQANGRYYPAASWLADRSEDFVRKASEAGIVASALDKEMRDFGISTITLIDLQQGAYYTSEQVAILINGLAGYGISGANSGWTVHKVWSEYNRVAREADAQSRKISADTDAFSDQRIDVRQGGTGVTPIVGLCLSPSEDLVLSLKYEYRTRLNIAVESQDDNTGLFTNGDTYRIDLPPILAIGIGYQPVYWLGFIFSYNMYFDRQAAWGRNLREKIHNRNVIRSVNSNSYDVALGVQLNLSDQFAFSVGSMFYTTGVADSFQSDFGFANTSWTAALGFQWNISEQLSLDAGFMTAFSTDEEVTFRDSSLTISGGRYREVYGRSRMGMGLGLSYSLFR